MEQPKTRAGVPPFRPRDRGFTLIELVLAVALLSGAFLGLLLLRISSVDRAYAVHLEGKVQRIAQEKLDEVVYGIETMTSGSIDGETGWDWEVEVFAPELTESLFPLLECHLTLRYTTADSEEAQEFRLSTRFFADETHPLRQYADVGVEEGR